MTNDVVAFTAAHPQPKRIRFWLRDGTIAEGTVDDTDEELLSALSSAGAGGIKVSSVVFSNREERVGHLPVASDQLLFLCGADHDFQVPARSGEAVLRPIELLFEGGATLRAGLPLQPRQRLTEYLNRCGEFILVCDAQLSPEDPIGNAIVNQSAVEILRDLGVGGNGKTYVRASAAARAKQALTDPQPAPDPLVETKVLDFPAPLPEDPPAVSSDDGTKGNHWLVTALRAAGVARSETLATKSTTAIEEAWASVRATCGISDAQLVEIVARHFRLPVAVTDKTATAPIARLPEKIARKYSVFPLREEAGQLVVAVSDPNDFVVEQALSFALRKRPIYEIASPAQIRAWLNAGYSDRTVELLLSSVGAEIAEAVRVVKDVGPESVGDTEVDAAPVIKLTNVILRDAINAGASDIHLEPHANSAVVRYRIDGVLENYLEIPLPALTRVISRIKILADLDIADRMRPQDGHSRVQIDGRKHDLRVSTVPTRKTEKLVIRIIQPEGNKRLSDIGAPEQEIQRLRELLSYRDGIVVVTGPTGSGKTTTLYAALREIATSQVNVMSVEDPVEYELSGITQIQVEPDRDVTFSSALRAILRQDPDIIFVGEIRDQETAEIAVHASMTGHLVLATLHTNDAITSIARFGQLGINNASVAATLRGAVAQRLLRRVCAACALQVDGDVNEAEERLAAAFGCLPVMRSRGCRVCNHSGFRGRLPIMEAMAVAPIEDMITAGASTPDLYHAAVAAGMRPMLQVALEFVESGQTTLQEVERVLGGANGLAPRHGQPRDATSLVRIS
jgi:type II secretory ATPase GspE/PulE/Tfp pilus assembly ATPase PilB-like protein